MPTYDYACEACGYEFEKFQSITSGPKKKCPGCGRFKLKRLIGNGSGIIFKGTGFYETDYRSDSYKADANKDLTKISTVSKNKESPVKPAKKTKAAS